jgi:hypothetical protein
MCCSDGCRKDRARLQSKLSARKAWRKSPKQHAKKLRQWRKENPDRVSVWSKKKWVKISNDPVLREKKRISDMRHYAETLRRPLLTRRCDTCSKPFTTRRSKQKYCCKHPCQAKALAAHAKVRRQQGLDSYYNSERRRESTKQYRIEHREQFKVWNREQKKRIETVEYWEDRLKKATNEGDKIWLRISQLKLARVRNLLAGKAGVAVKAGAAERNNDPSRRASPSPKRASTPRSNSQG